MKLYIEKRAICITHNVIYAALISSYFNNEESYFALFNFPQVEPNLESLTSMIATERANVHIKNRIIDLEPNYIILAGLTTYQKSFFLKSFPKKRFIEIDNIDKIDEKLRKFNDFKGVIECRTNDLLLALLISKKENRKIVINNEANNLILNSKEKCGLVVIENEIDLSGIIAVNYAYSIKADIKIIDCSSKEEVSFLGEYFYQFKKSKQDYINKCQNKLDEINNKINKIDFKKYKFVTFFTEGIPYGYFIDNIIPSSHVFRKMPQYFIFDNIYFESTKKLFFSLLSFSIFNNDESVNINKLFLRGNYFIKNLDKKENSSTKKYFKGYIPNFPYDILHIGSHGGNIDGFFVSHYFFDREGDKHNVCYYEIQDFELVDKLDHNGDKMIGVNVKNVFISLDGYKWMSDEIQEANIPQYVYDDMENALHTNEKERNQQNITKIPYKGYIPTANYIECLDNIHQCNFHYLGGQTSPMIFNNSCHSWLYIAEYFIGIGARAYIGTLWGIGTETAKYFATNFYRMTLIKGKYIIDVVHLLNKRIKNPKYRDIYIFWGLHFNKINKTKITLNIIRQRLSNYIIGFMQMLMVKTKTGGKNNREDVKTNSEDDFLFLEKILIEDFECEAKKIIKDNDLYQELCQK